MDTPLYSAVDLGNAISFGPYKKGFKLEVPLSFQTPRMYIPFGLSKFAADFGDRWNLDFSLEGHPKFVEFLRRVDEYVIRHIHRHHDAIFGCKMTIEDIKKSYTSNLKPSSNPERYAPTFRVKVDDTHFYDAEGNLLFEEEGETKDERGFKGLQGIGIFELSSVYFFNKRMGCTWKAEQIKIIPASDNNNKRQKISHDDDGPPGAGDEEVTEGGGITSFAFRGL